MHTPLRSPVLPRAAWRTACALAVALLAPATPARAAFPASPTHAVLTTSSTSAELRARLDSLARALTASDPSEAGGAWYYLGSSADRSGMRDSALAAYERALALRGNREERLAAVDLRLRREAPGDARAALALLAAALEESSGQTAMSQAQIAGRQAWAYFLAGRADSASLLFRGLEDVLGSGLEWRYRIGKAALANGDATRAYEMLYPVALASRTKDEDVMIDLHAAATRLGSVRQLDTQIEQDLHDRDAREQRRFSAWQGRRVLFTGTDGFPLTGIALPPAGRTRRRGAVVLMAPGDSVVAADSLALALQRAGYGVILVPPRGSNWSVAPSLPVPDAWAGREEDLERLAARDAPRALRALATVAPVDTTRYLVVGVSGAATAACLAARFDPQVRALLLVSPAVATVDRGPTRAALTAARIPAFFQIAPEDFNASYDLSDLLYQAGDRAASRVVEARTAGRALAQFRADPSLTQRFVEWLNGVLKPPRPAPSRSAPPRARPR